MRLITFGVIGVIAAVAVLALRSSREAGVSVGTLVPPPKYIMVISDAPVGRFGWGMAYFHRLDEPPPGERRVLVPDQSCSYCRPEPAFFGEYYPAPDPSPYPEKHALCPNEREFPEYHSHNFHLTDLRFISLPKTFKCTCKDPSHNSD